MELIRRKKVVKETDDLLQHYPHVLMLYKTPPTGEMSVTEFEDVAYERVRLLQVIEQASQMGNKLYSPEWRAAIIGYLKKQELRRYIRLLESTGCSSTSDADTLIRRDDYLSHYILRLAYCRSFDLRNWFIAREVELFKMRFMNLSPEGLKTFVSANHLHYTPISADEKDAIKDGLLQSTIGYSHVQIETSDFYKVPFTEVLDLIRNSTVYINKGYAYIPTNDLVSCITTWYRSHLNTTMLNASKILPSIDDERLTGLLTSLHSTYTTKDYCSAENQHEGITADNLHTYVRKSFPLCMRYLYDIIKTTHHMKHFGRLQFGLFLKGIGVNLTEAIKYWRTEFCKLMDSEKFDKGYLYNIKHSYGTIGKMTSYNPYGCKKVISTEPGPGEHHGCPFKTWGSDVLKQKILEYGVPMEGATEIIDIASKGHFQIACTKYFAHIHGGVASKQVINHPNQYFEESLEILAPNDAKIMANNNKKRKHPEQDMNKSLSDSKMYATQETVDADMFTDDFDFSDVA